MDGRSSVLSNRIIYQPVSQYSYFKPVVNPLDPDSLSQKSLLLTRRSKDGELLISTKAIRSVSLRRGLLR